MYFRLLHVNFSRRQMPIIHSMSDLMSNADFVGDWTQTDRLLYGAEIEVSKTTTSIAERCANVILLAANNPPNSAPNPIEGLTAYEVTTAESNFTLLTQTSTTRFTARIWALLTCAVGNGYAGKLPTVKLSTSTDPAFASQLDSPTMRRAIVNSWSYNPDVTDYDLLVVTKGTINISPVFPGSTRSTLTGHPPTFDELIEVGYLRAYIIRDAMPANKPSTPDASLILHGAAFLEAEVTHIYLIPRVFESLGTLAFNFNPIEDTTTSTPGAVYYCDTTTFKPVEIAGNPVRTPAGNRGSKTAPEIQIVYFGQVTNSALTADDLVEFSIDPYNGTIAINAGGDYLPSVLELPELFYYTKTVDPPDARDFLAPLVPAAAGIATSLLTHANPIGAIVSGAAGLITGLPQEQITETDVGTYRTDYKQGTPFLTLNAIDYTTDSVRTAELLESTEGLPAGGYTTLPPAETKALYRGELHEFNPGITPSYPYYCPIGEFKNDLNTDFASGITFT